ncbi:MAG: hypothetical protein IJ125_03360 [Atopobiaceae bacterium]|nr:hypothetical protein [Atopobiaceae bacterium]
MSSSFADRLDRIMAATRTSNSALARALSFDASYICRIRSGKRGLPIRQPFIEPASAYLVNRIRDEHARHVVSAELGHPLPEDATAAKALLASWLSSDDMQTNSSAIQHLFDALEFSQPSIRHENHNASARHPTKHDHNTKEMFFYGNEGKRAAILTFLTQLVATNKPHTLLLHSDEDMTWLYEDKEFSKQWKALMLKLITTGSQIRIIHSISRNSNEMWEAVKMWLPLYATGAIEPYYYPLLRDGVYRRTLFVASKHSAIAATSLNSGGDATDWLNMLLYDRQAVTALEHEFSAYFSLCRPLMRIHTSKEAILRVASEFADNKGTILASRADDRFVCTCEDGHALLVSTSSVPVAFETAETRMVGAIWEYLRNLPAEELSQGAEAHELLVSLVSHLASP